MTNTLTISDMERIQPYVQRTMGRGQALMTCLNGTYGLLSASDSTEVPSPLVEGIRKTLSRMRQEVEGALDILPRDPALRTADDILAQLEQEAHESGPNDQRIA